MPTTLLPSIAELNIWDCNVAPSTLPECAIAVAGLRVLRWLYVSKFDLHSIHLATLATCRAAFAHPARVVDLVFKVDLYLDDDECDEVKQNEFVVEVQEMRDEWQSERARLRAARVGGGGEVHLEIENV